jgi:hypothetical protein
MVSLSAEHRAGAGVDVVLERDTAPRSTCRQTSPRRSMPRPEARRTFDGLSYSKKSWHVLQAEGAKTDETRQRRIAKSVDMLKQGRAR